ncbi:TetR/AcrR family transcriptional regulator [Streptococcus cameli]
MSKFHKHSKSKQALIFALFDLSWEKEFSTIPIKDICQKSKIGRSTFYNHFSDKDDLSRYIITYYNHLVHAIILQDSVEPRTSSKNLKEELFEHTLHLLEHQTAMYSLLFSPFPSQEFKLHLEDVIKQRMSRIVYQKEHPYRVPDELIIDIFANIALQAIYYFVEQNKRLDFPIYANYFELLQSITNLDNPTIEKQTVKLT